MEKQSREFYEIPRRFRRHFISAMFRYPRLRHIEDRHLFSSVFEVHGPVSELEELTEMVLLWQEAQDKEQVTVEFPLGKKGSLEPFDSVPEVSYTVSKSIFSNKVVVTGPRWAMSLVDAAVARHERS